MTLTFMLMPGCLPSRRRGVGVLSGHSELNVELAFDALPEKHQRDLRSRIDSWTAGNDRPSHHFHGFPNDKEHKQCFVFKCGDNHRFYGFLCHPFFNENPRFVLCVLCIHATKNQRQTDKAELDRVNQWKDSFGARQTISAVAIDQEGGKWKK